MSPRGRRRTVEPPEVTPAEVTSWFTGAVPDSWFTGPPQVRVDRDEILVTGTLPSPQSGEGVDASLAARSRIAAFREETRAHRMAIADRAQEEFVRVVSWGAVCGTEAATFTTASVPVMTRLDLDERGVLDTLIESGVARSRSEALAWCVRLVAANEAGWIERLRSAMADVAAVRDEGPASRSRDDSA